MSEYSIVPWNDGTMANDLLRIVPSLPRIRLDQLEAPGVPGCYVQFIAATEAEPILGPVIASGRYLSYVGVAATNLRSRIGRYRQSIAELSFDERNLHLALVPCGTAASALFAERVLIERLDPVLNGLGWGSRVPGSRRSPRCSAVDALFPGRPWAAPASRSDEARARMLVLSNLARMDPTGPRWPALN